MSAAKSAVVLTVNRCGEFNIISSSPGNQCGSENTTSYKYEVAISAHADNLDSDGFVIDSLEIDDYFQKYYDERKIRAESCEKIATKAVEFFSKFKNVSFIRVKIKGRDVSHIDAVWNRQ